MFNKGLLNTTVFVLVLQISSAVYGQGNDLAPPGYQWESCQTMGCHFLVPDGWSFEQLDKKDVLKFHITKERHNRKTPPRININILQNTESRTGLSAFRHMELFMGDLARSAKVLETWKHKSGALRSTAATSLHYARVEEPLKKFSLLITNEKTGTLYVFTFEAVPEDWESEWVVVEKIFTRLRLDEKL